MKKNILSLILFLFVASVPLFGQANDKPKVETKKETIKKEFQDLNANGIDDAKEFQNQKAQQKKTKSRDMFIDTDGDGICDGRANGAGLKLRLRGANAAKQSHKGKK